MRNRSSVPRPPVLGGNASIFSCWTFPGSPPFPHVQTESNFSHYWFKLERMGVCCIREGRTPDALEAVLAPMLWARVKGSTYPPCILLPGPCSLLLKAP